MLGHHRRMHPCLDAAGGAHGDTQQLDAVAQVIGGLDIGLRDLLDAFDVDLVERHFRAECQTGQQRQFVRGVETADVERRIGFRVALLLSFLQDLCERPALFLHRVEVNLPEAKRRVLHQLHQTDAVLAGKKALIVDDDVRNIFALTSALENVQMEVLYAENGRDALSLLESSPDIDVVLMDVMMPEMDGYETMRAIRKMEQFRSLPIIALTAKAMKGDREKCVEAGASDYISKPANIDQLLSLLRVWLYR